MRKRILSLLLALTLVLSAGVFGVIPALAADSCVSVKADAVTTGEVVAGSLLEIKLTDVFEDTDGHTLTYTLTNAAQFSAQTRSRTAHSMYQRKTPAPMSQRSRRPARTAKSLQRPLPSRSRKLPTDWTHSITTMRPPPRRSRCM